ncbi:acyltransferase family protein [Leifsonia sp. P73]|uniref:acyltransferase family protein n=1 Tax=Leifsonia sp. P73 TaxID=3423959 RepID=UPI003DA3AF6A
MSLATSTPRPSIDLTRRDLAVDLVRVCCVLVVVTAHLLMVGVGFGADGALEISKPLTEQPWFAAVSVFGQVMPLFFALGGFAAITGWRSLRARGGDGADFLHARLIRLVRPTLPVFVFFTVALWGARGLGAPEDVIAGVAAGVGTPLWFLAAFLLCQWAAPLMIRLHERAPWHTLVGLAGAATAVDLFRLGTGVAMVGLINLAFVWLFAQQLGFLYADGVFFRMRRRWLLALAAAAASLTVAGVAGGVYSPDMLANQYPAVFAIGLLAIVQLCGLVLVHPALTALMRTRPARALTFVVGSRLMTVYLWHLTCIIAITAVCLLVPGWHPAPGSVDWWASRPLVLVAAFALVLLLSLAVARFERGPRPLTATERRAPAWRVQLATLLAFVPPFVILIHGLDPTLALFGLSLYSSALILIRPDRVATGRTTRGGGSDRRG